MYKVILLTVPRNKGRYLLPLMEKNSPLWWIQNKFRGEHGSTAKGKMLDVVGGNWLDQAPTSLATMAFNTTQYEPRKSLGGVKGASTDMPEFRRLEVLMFGQQMVSSPRARA